MSERLLLALVLLSSPALAVADGVEVEVTGAWIALSTPGGGVASDGDVAARAGTDVRLYAVVEARVDGRRRLFSAASEVRRGRTGAQKASRWPDEYGPIRLTWYKLEADPIEDGIYDNTGTMERVWHPLARQDHPARWHWCPIDYVETDTRWGNVWTHAADAVPTTTPNYGGLGTMRFVLRAEHDGTTVFSPGKDHRDKTGLRPGIAMVRFRRDDTPVGYMTELMNVPYVYGSSSPTQRPRDHQTERAVGADCADLVVYGWRRAGRKMDYTWTGGLRGMSDRRAFVADLRTNLYRKEDGRPVAFGDDIRAGDLLLWRGHVAVIAEADPSGYLTPDTKILQSVIEVPALIPLKKIGFGFDNPPFDIRRARWER